jgi:taurine dioxygenase
MELHDSTHPVIHKHPFNNLETFFLGCHTHTMLEEDSPLSLLDLIKFTEDCGIYSHKWEEGDLLIWDNIQVMHRSAGKFEGRRLLYRV